MASVASSAFDTNWEHNLRTHVSANTAGDGRGVLLKRNDIYFHRRTAIAAKHLFSLLAAAAHRHRNGMHSLCCNSIDCDSVWLEQRTESQGECDSKRFRITPNAILNRFSMFDILASLRSPFSPLRPNRSRQSNLLFSNDRNTIIRFFVNDKNLTPERTSWGSSEWQVSVLFGWLYLHDIPRSVSTKNIRITFTQSTPRTAQPFDRFHRIQNTWNRFRLLRDTFYNFIGIGRAFARSRWLLVRVGTSCAHICRAVVENESKIARERERGGERGEKNQINVKSSSEAKRKVTEGRSHSHTHEPIYFLRLFNWRRWQKWIISLWIDFGMTRARHIPKCRLPHESGWHFARRWAVRIQWILIEFRTSASARSGFAPPSRVLI